MTKLFRDYLFEGQRSVLLIGARVGDHDIQGYIEKHLKQPTKFVSWGEVCIRDGIVCAGLDPLEGFNFVFIGPVVENDQLCTCVHEYVEQQKIPHLFYGSSSGLNNKPLQSVKLGLSGVPQIKTIIASGEDISSAELVKALGLPVISKITDGAQGRGIEKHESASSLKKILNSGKIHIFQKFVPNSGDYRVFFIRSKHIYTIKRKRTTEEFKNNVSLGGTEEFVDLPGEAMKVARDAVKTMGFGVTGVDLIQHQSNKKWYVMEVNSAPQFSGKEFEMVMAELVRQIQK